MVKKFFTIFMFLLTISQPVMSKETKTNVSYMSVLLSYSSYMKAANAFQIKDIKNATLNIDKAIRINPQSHFLHRSALQFKRFTSYDGEYLFHTSEIHRLYSLESLISENTALWASVLSFTHLQINSLSLYETYAMEAFRTYESLGKYDLAAKETSKFAARQRVLKKTNSAEIYFLKAVEIGEKHLKTDSPELLTYKHDLANFYYYEKKLYQKAFLLFYKSVEKSEQILAFDDPILSTRILDYANVSFSLRLYDIADGAYKKSLDLFKKTKNPSAAGLLNRMRLLALNSKANEKYVEAANQFKEEIETREKLDKSNIVELAVAYKNIADTYKFMNNEQYSINYLLKLIDLENKKETKNNLIISNHQNEVAFLYASLKDYNKSNAFALLRMQYAEMLYGVNDPRSKQVALLLIKNAREVGAMDYVQEALLKYKQ